MSTQTFRFVASALLLCASAVPASAQQQKLSEPLFGIPYDPRKIHFGKMPNDLVTHCPKLQGRYVAAWVYGHLKTSDSEYFLIYGLMEFQEDSPRATRTVAPEEGDGLAVALRGSTCLVDQADYFFSQDVNPAKKETPIMVPAAIVNGLLWDAFQKYVAAFGGKQAFLKLVKRGVAIPPVQDQLDLFAKQPS